MIKIDGQVNYIGDRCLLLTPSQRQEILEVSTCRKKDPYLISEAKAKISISLCNIAIDVFISQATWGFRCCCQACTEDKDEPVRLLLAQLQPRLGVMIMKIRWKED